MSILLRHIIGAVSALLLATAASAQVGVSPTQIVIGQTLTLQNGQNAYGVDVTEGVQAALDRVNRSGGVFGRRISVKLLDDNNQAAQAEANARSLINLDKVFLVFGSIEGGPSMAVLKATTELGTPFFAPMAGSPGLRTPHQPLVFPVRAEHKAEFRALMAHARSLGMTRVAFFRSDSETGQQHLANVQRLAQELNLELVADLAFKSDIDAAGISAMAAQLANSKAQMVFNHGGIGTYEKLIRRSRETGGRTQFYAVNSGSTQLAQSLGPLAHGMIFAQVLPSPWERKTEASRAYQEAYTRFKPGKGFSYGSFEGYLSAMALVEALRRAGPQPTRDSFVAGLRNVVLDVHGLQISFRNGDHAGLPLVDLAIYTRDGRFMH
ncbi:ABC transporter substrate-binding protein [Hydrogenophaga sp.]|uniref:ABC transporter substrate-binding protein n=1 Tax=Hydrogenophaga sp. TaxID=1904254 RepID=UPI002C534B47|nr:ABC transporter substrate-binding protein [Hydrogenophaga sp.]HMP11848.1 ABC transporter substrate-binding protein [Hydrogenophaga sp.]